MNDGRLRIQLNDLNWLLRVVNLFDNKEEVHLNLKSKLSVSEERKNANRVLKIPDRPLAAQSELFGNDIAIIGSGF